MRRLLYVVTVVYTALLIMRPQEFVPALANLPLLQIVVLTAFGIWALTPSKGVDLPQFWILPLFLFFVWLSLGFAGWWGGIVPALELLLPPIFLFVIVTGCVRSVRELKIFSALVIFCACIIVLHGHLQRTTGIGWTGEPMIQGRITYSGIFNDPNDIGLLVVLSIALCFFHLRTQQKSVRRWLTWVVLGWLLYGVYLTNSRGTMLATLTVFGLEAWRSYGKTVVLIAGAVALPVLLKFTRLSELNAEEASAGDRVDAWYEGIQMLIDNPVFGVGWRMFGDHHGMTAHNSFVLAMAELGLTGYALWLAFVGLTAWMILRLAFPSTPAEAKPKSKRIPAPPAVAATFGPRLPRYDMAAFGVFGSATHVPRSGRRLPPRGIAPAIAADQDAGAAIADESTERLAARSLLFAMSGFLIGAFFLSQAYKAMLFINCGLVVGRYLGMRELGFPVPRLSFGEIVPLVVGATLASVVGMWILVRILL